MQKYDVVLMEKPGEEGLTKNEICSLLDKLDGSPLSVYPVEFANRGGESCAMGFITEDGARKIEFEYDDQDPLGNDIGEILADMDKETPDGTYRLCGLTVFITR